MEGRWEFFFTYLAVLDALHSAHGSKATDERAALPLHTVGLHLGSVQHITSTHSQYTAETQINKKQNSIMVYKIKYDLASSSRHHKQCSTSTADQPGLLLHLRHGM